MKIIIIFVMVALTSFHSAGDSVVEPTLALIADFDVKKIPAVENIVRKQAAIHSLEIIESDRDQVKFVTRGVDAFQIFLGDGKKTILLISNAGLGTFLSINFFETDKFKKDKIELLLNDILPLLREQGIHPVITNAGIGEVKKNRTVTF